MNRTRLRTVSPEDAVPVAERFRVLQYVRVAAVGLVLLCAALAPDILAPGRRQAVLTTLLYAGTVAVLAGVAHVVRERVVPVLSLLLIVDGAWLAWVGYLTGGLDSPLRYVILMHLGAVALVASYRTALKIALWYSLLLYGLFTGVHNGTLPPTSVVRSESLELQQIVVFIIVLWLVAASTSALSAVNERELRRRRLDLEALTAVAEQLERASDSTTVASTLLDAAIHNFDFDRGVVLGGPHGELNLLASHGRVHVSVPVAGPGPSELIARAHREKASLLVQDLDPPTDPWLASLLPSARDLVVVPLSAEGRPIGALVLVHGRDVQGSRRALSGRLQRRVVTGLERSAAYAALALRNAWLLEQVQQLAATDGLTQIANRRTFEASLEREVGRALRSGERLSLVMLDIDHFKRLNDERGHQAGDEVLRNVAAALSGECRDGDIPARYGGEEFAVVLPGCDLDAAAVIAERLRQAVSSSAVGVKVTASAGVACFPSHADDADTLVRAADDALYASKRDGRDRTTVSAGIERQETVDALLGRAIAQRKRRADSSNPVIDLPD